MTKAEMTAQTQLNLAVVALVALVAIVGLVALVMNAPAVSAGVYEVYEVVEEPLVYEEGTGEENLVGDARRMKRIQRAHP